MHGNPGNAPKPTAGVGMCKERGMRGGRAAGKAPGMSHSSVWSLLCAGGDVLVAPGELLATSTRFSWITPSVWPFPGMNHHQLGESTGSTSSFAAGVNPGGLRGWSARFGAAPPAVSAQGQSQQGQSDILRGRRCTVWWVRTVSVGEGQSWWGCSALWGAGSTGECGAGQPSATLSWVVV